MFAVNPAGVVERAVPARNGVLIEILVGQREGGIRGELPVGAEIHALLRIAGVFHAADGVVLDVAEVLGGQAEPNAEFSANSSLRLQAPDVAALAIGAELVGCGPAEVGLAVLPRAEIR